MTSIILDTHYFYWYINQTPNKISAPLAEMIRHADEVCISTISCLEMAMLVKRQRIVLKISYQDWYEKAITQTDIKVLPVTAEIAHLSVALPEHHKDPHDRIIIATALQYQHQLASCDNKFAWYEELRGGVYT